MWETGGLSIVNFKKISYHNRYHITLSLNLTTICLLYLFLLVTRRSVPDAPNHGTHLFISLLFYTHLSQSQKSYHWILIYNFDLQFLESDRPHIDVTVTQIHAHIYTDRHTDGRTDIYISRLISNRLDIWQGQFLPIV